MRQKRRNTAALFISALLFATVACGTAQPTVTSTPEPTSTNTPVPTHTSTSTPTQTPRPTQTPDRVATRRARERTEEVQTYFDKGYLATTKGRFIELGDFSYDWARLGTYMLRLLGESASDFFMSSHIQWDSAFRDSGRSGCGYIFSYQENSNHYAVILDRSKVHFLITDLSQGYSGFVTPTRGTGLVDFDYPVETDFTLIVKDINAYVLVEGEMVGEYTLARSRPMNGELGLTVLSSTNRDFGTRCEITDLRLWIPNP